MIDVFFDWVLPMVAIAIAFFSVLYARRTEKRLRALRVENEARDRIARERSPRLGGYPSANVPRSQMKPPPASSTRRRY